MRAKKKHTVNLLETISGLGMKEPCASLPLSTEKDAVLVGGFCAEVYSCCLKSPLTGDDQPVQLQPTRMALHGKQIDFRASGSEIKSSDGHCLGTSKAVIHVLGVGN